MATTIPTVTVEEYKAYLQNQGFDELRAHYAITNSIILNKVDYDPKSGMLTVRTVASAKPPVKRYTMREDKRGFNSIAAAGN